MRVLYNKFPFAPWHLLVVPEPEQTLPQFLTQTHHARMMALVTEQADALPGLGMAFNSLGAYASINQLHFQGFVREAPFPVELPRWRHNGGEDEYPLECWHYGFPTGFVAAYCSTASGQPALQPAVPGKWLLHPAPQRTRHGRTACMGARYRLA